MKQVPRSGIVRLCADCKAEIQPDNGCACPTVETPFAPGAEVTVCANADNRPLALATVKRHGFGAFRLSTTGDWYEIATGRSHHNQRENYVRLRREGDAEAIQVETVRAARRARTLELGRQRREAQARAATAERHVAEGLRSVAGVQTRLEIVRQEVSRAEHTVRANQEILARLDAEIAALAALESA